MKIKTRIEHPNFQIFLRYIGKFRYDTGDIQSYTMYSLFLFSLRTCGTQEYDWLRTFEETGRSSVIKNGVLRPGKGTQWTNGPRRKAESCWR